jgi:hypothetical protein
MRRRAPGIAGAWLALASAATLATGCAGSAASASETAGERAEARAFAGAVNLRPADLPGFKVVFENEEGRPSPLDRRVERCDGGPIVSAADHGVFSPLLQKQKVPVQTVLSGVYRMRSPSIASAYISAADSPQGLRCTEREEVHKRASLPAGVRGEIEVSALRRPLGAAGASGARVWKCLAGPQPCSRSSSRSFTDRLWFAAGPYVVALFYIAGAQNEARGHEPVALLLERRLIALLYSRAQARTP